MTTSTAEPGATVEIHPWRRSPISAALDAPTGRYPKQNPDADAAAAAPAPPISVAVLADDLVTWQGAAAFLRTQPGLRMLPSARRREAEVVLVLVAQVTDETLNWMQAEVAATDGRDVKFVLVGDGVREHHLLRAVTHGLISVISRREADFERIAQAIRDAREGRSQLPPVELGWLLKQIRAVQLDVLAPNGLSASGLESREVDVLTLLADGLDTMEIAQRLCYSERTVKNIIHGLLTRLNLRNRAHAVSYALRHQLL
jgi:DNA-binding NarL/FixJ family response regulator